MRFIITEVYPKREHHMPQGDMSGRKPEVGDIVRLASFRQEGKTTVWCIEENNEYGAWFELSMLEEQK